MEEDRELIAKTQGHFLIQMGKMRNNAINLISAKLTRMIQDDYETMKKLVVCFDKIVDKNIPYDKENMDRYFECRKAISNTEAKITELKEAVYLLRNGYDPRRLSRTILDDPKPSTRKEHEEAVYG